MSQEGQAPNPRIPPHFNPNSARLCVFPPSVAPPAINAHADPGHLGSLSAPWIPRLCQVAELGLSRQDHSMVVQDPGQAGTSLAMRR